MPTVSRILSYYAKFWVIAQVSIAKIICSHPSVTPYKVLANSLPTCDQIFRHFTLLFLLSVHHLSYLFLIAFWDCPTFGFWSDMPCGLWDLLHTQVFAFPNYLQSNEFVTGGLQSSFESSYAPELSLEDLCWGSEYLFIWEISVSDFQ